MYTRDIKLEQISAEDYNKIKEEWRFPKEARSIDSFAMVVNPLAHDNYEELFDFLLEHPHAYTLNVRRDSRWVRISRDNSTKSKLKGLAKIADGNRIKRNYLSISYRIDPYIQTSAEIEFIERNGLVIGYRVSIPQHLSGMHDLFDYTGVIPTQFGFTQSLSNPQSRIYLRPNLVRV